VSAPRPYTLVAELTYACPLACPYCSNPIDFASQRAELGAEDWKRVFTEAEALGVMQLHLTGGEPLVRKDLEALAVHARSLGMYVNLVTSGVPLERARLQALRDAGVDHVQLSIQDARAESSDSIAGTTSFEQKMRVAAWVKELGMPLTMNTVLHRRNLDRVEEIVALAEQLKADRLELANTQYLGWALENRARLLPTRAQLERAATIAEKARARLEGKMEILFVKPDYFGQRPRACMDGWGRRFVVVAPDGLVLPCHEARSIEKLAFESVQNAPLEQIWERGEALSAFRGEAWMPEPCKSCDRRAIDFGGCRCQAFALTGDARATDPACALSPMHSIVERARDVLDDGAFVYRGSLVRRRP
jgi:pyrroloquinoline quinone biosynthesis protein E